MTDKIAGIPTVTLALGPAGSGKTRWALDRLAASEAPGLLIVSSAQEAETRAQQAAAKGYFSEAEARVRIIPFHALVRKLLRSEKEPMDAPVGRAFQRMALSDIFRNVTRPEDYFGGMLSAPGFIPALQERLREWKLAGLSPEMLEMCAGTIAVERPAFARKLVEMARLFRKYAEFMQEHHLQDEEDGWQTAAHRVRAGESSLALSSAPYPLILDGFYRFTRAQRDLLAALSQGDPDLELAVTLPYEAKRPLLFAASARTRAQFHAEFQAREICLSESATDLPRPLRQLSAKLFNLSPAASVPAFVPEELQSIRIFDAPNPYMEAEMVARAFRRLKREKGLAWSEFAIILRSLGDYTPILSAVFERMEIPLGVDGPERLADNPLLKTVLAFLEVVRTGWQREEVLCFLKSSYLSLDKLDADLLRKRARAAGVRSGRERWLALAAETGEAGHETGKILSMMSELDLRFTLQKGDIAHFAAIVEETVQQFGLEERLRTGGRFRQERDLAALREGRESIHALARMAAIRQQGPGDFTQFYDALREAWENSSSIAGCEGDHVRVTEPYNTRETSVRAAAVMGLTERVFPRRIMEDPFLRDEERTLLALRTGIELEAQKNRADDERLLFYLAVTAPSEHLILSFPRASQEADTLPSFYLDEVRATVPECETVVRTLADVAPREGEAVSEEDALLSACAALFDPICEEDPSRRKQQREAAADRLQKLMTNSPIAPQSRETLASRFLPRLPRLHDDAVRSHFVGAERVYQVAELESYARCPFQYLLRHTWKLRGDADGLDAGMQTSLMRNLLRRYFRQRARLGKGVLEAAERDEARIELGSLLRDSLNSDKLDLTFHVRRMLLRRLSDALDGFVQRETSFSPQFGMIPGHFHLTYGLAPNGGTISADPLSCPEPLVLSTGKDPQESISVSGVIDRLDLDWQGEKALVLSYEGGPPPEFSAVQRGENLQLPLHLLAVERLFGMAGAVGCSDSMQSTGRNRFYRIEHVNLKQFGPISPHDDNSNVKPISREQWAELAATAEASAIRTARSLADARVEAVPGVHCRICSYRDICRTSVIEGHDGERE